MAAPSTSPAPTLLLTLSGADRPGVTAALLRAIAAHGEVTVRDVEQVVIQGRLVLGILLSCPLGTAAVSRTARASASALGFDIDLRTDAEEPAPRPGRLHVTVLGQPLRPGALAGVAGVIADRGANIDRIEPLASYPVTAVELEVSGAEPDELRKALAREAAAQQVDVAVQRSGLYRRAKRLVVLDVDSTLVQGEVIEMLAERAGAGERVAEVTAAAMRGEIDFAASLVQRVALLAGLPASVLDEVRAAVRLSPGARTLVRTLRRLGYTLGIVSGGFTQVTDALAADLGIDHTMANTLEVVDGVLTGRVVGPVVDRAGKAAALRRFAAAAGVPMTQTVAVGDGANDLDMLAAAGLGIAFNAKPVVREAADASVNVPYLDAVLFLLGISRGEIEMADAEDGLAVAPRDR